MRIPNSQRRTPLTTAAADAPIYSFQEFNGEYTITNRDEASDRICPWVIRFNGELISKERTLKSAKLVAGAHLDQAIIAANIESAEAAAAMPDPEPEPEKTIEELLSDGEGGGVAIVSKDYGEDEEQLIRNADFQAFAMEIPVGYKLSLSRHAFTMMVNEETRRRGFQYSFIGTPRKAMREVRRLNAALYAPDSTKDELREALTRLDGRIFGN